MWKMMLALHTKDDFLQIFHDTALLKEGDIMLQEISQEILGKLKVHLGPIPSFFIKNGNFYLILLGFYLTFNFSLIT